MHAPPEAKDSHFLANRKTGKRKRSACRSVLLCVETAEDSADSMKSSANGMLN
jgi:hypothetical protein